MNVLTGETGAGKSIIVDALELLFGERINSETVRDPEQKSVIEGVLDIEPDSAAASFLQETGLLDEEDEYSLVIRREISSQGRSINRVNGRTVTAAILRSLADYLVDIHLQHDNQQVLNQRMHLHLLDGFSPLVKEKLPVLNNIYKDLRQVENLIEEIVASERKRAQELDLVGFQVNEIESAALSDGEEEELTRERNRMLNAGKLNETIEQLENLLFQGAYNVCKGLARSREVARGVADSFLEELLAALDEAYYMIEDFEGRLNHFRSELEFEPSQLELAEARLNEINRIKRKYGSSVEEVLLYLEQARARQVDLEGLELRMEELEQERKKLKEQFVQIAEDLSRERRLTAEALEARVHQELLDLSLPGVRFKILVESAKQASATGLDDVNFMFSANPGEELRPIERTASGGEISRFILALKSALAGAYNVPILVFDEIDVGLGGQPLRSLGMKVAQLSREHQIIMVTHSPQVASLANHHTLLEKNQSEIRTTIFARTLDRDERIEELARMLSGDRPTETVREHVRQMMEEAPRTKK